MQETLMLLHETKPYTKHAKLQNMITMGEKWSSPAAAATTVHDGSSKTQHDSVILHSGEKNSEDAAIIKQSENLW